MPLEVFFHFYPGPAAFALFAVAPTFPPPPPPPPPPAEDDGLIDLDEADPDLAAPLPPGPHWRRASDAVLDPAWNPATDPLPAPGYEHVDFGGDGFTVHTWTLHDAGSVWVEFRVRWNGAPVADAWLRRH